MNEEKQLQDLEITFKGGPMLGFKGIAGYQIGGAVIAIITEDNRTIVYPFADIEKVVIFAKDKE